MNGSMERWVGIDVAKSKLDVALLDERGKVKSHVFNNDTKGHAALMSWLIERAGPQANMRVCMEATGPYSETLAMTLADAGWYVSVKGRRPGKCPNSGTRATDRIVVRDRRES